MKKILGLDLGTTSIGWALVNEAGHPEEQSSIIKLGVRVIPLSVDELTNFEKGAPITSNADRTLKRSMRRNLQRYKLRRENLIEILKAHKIIPADAVLSEEGNRSTFKTLADRAKAATDQISLQEFGKVLLMINKKRGYKSSRKAKNEEEGQLIDGMEIAKVLYENELTPGQFVYQRLEKGKSIIPDFYRSDLQNELDKIWAFQKQFHADLLTEVFRKEIEGKGKQATSKFLLGKYKIFTAENKGTREEKTKQSYRWRVEALSRSLSKEELAHVLVEVNGDLNSSSGYLGTISDRSKELYFKKLTVGQYQYNQIKENPHARLKGQVFYRQDYLHEFDTIWEKQAEFHKDILTPALKSEVRDIIIFYQRKLKSQKGLISFCEFESQKKEVLVDGQKKIKMIGSRVCPRSSPLFQEFKIWQTLNQMEVTNKRTKEKWLLSIEEKRLLFHELNIKEKLSSSEVLKLLYKKPTDLELNYENDIDGNRTNAALFNAYSRIAEISGHRIDIEQLSAAEKISAFRSIFEVIGIKTDILDFDSSLEGKAYEQQSSFRLWHLLYSYEDDASVTGDEKLIVELKEKFGFEKEYARILAGISLLPDYGSLSTKAIRKILPHLKDGCGYDIACTYAGYNHSDSSKKEEHANRPLKPHLEILRKNELRNPVVEKIINQMINVVNTVIDEYGKPDEVRIELARELKKNAEERKKATESITKATAEHEAYRKKLQTDPVFNLKYVSRNDIIRYKLYLELESNGFRTLYTDTYISPEELFSKNFDIEHIIPQSRLFDDSFSNKTIELRSANIEKGDKTAYDYVKEKYGEEGLKKYEARLENLVNGKGDKAIGKTKYRKLLMQGSEIPSDFIERDLRNTQYISKMAKSLLEDVIRDVNTTTGSITERLRSDWQLVDVLQELNWNKYKALGLTYYETNRDGQQLPRIKDWTKRNDHRHHAMDALTVAFTKHNHVNYLNNLNARTDKSSNIYGIEQKELYRDEKNKLRFKPPIPLNDFRAEAKKHLENALISFKAKNKVVTQNSNRYKTAKGIKSKTELTPRGQLHLETVYGSAFRYEAKEEKVGSHFDKDTIMRVAKKEYQEALLKRLEESGNDPKKAFTGKNSLEKNPIYLDTAQTRLVPSRVKLVSKELVYTTRKTLSPTLFMDSKKNDNFLNRVEDIFDNAVRDALRTHYNKVKTEVEEYNSRVTKEKDKKKVLETAFSNLEQQPVWLNKEKGIRIKRVTIAGISNAVALHDKKDKDRKTILNKEGKPMPVDFVSTGNNHHVAIYRDDKGNLQDEIKSFFEVVQRVNEGIDIIDKNLNGWNFLFSMKQNEFFVFPNELTGFDPNKINLLDENNYHLISPNLFRVQKLSKLTYGNSAVREYVFRHHLETTLNDKKELKDIVYKNIKSLPYLERIVKVRLNHLGRIVQVGEY